jgi:hypothetical protein
MTKPAGYIYACIFTGKIFGIGHTEAEALEDLCEELDQAGITLVESTTDQYDKNDRLIPDTTPLSSFVCLKATDRLIRETYDGLQKWDRYGDLACTNEEYWELYHADRAKKQGETL